ncbi:MAG: hypothetical protein Q8891_11750 [Bacteroidota bacterium]|nr:hypothetical protein [Bacteroidota bacterium]
MKNFFLFLVSGFLCLSVYSQEIDYSQPESNDIRSLDFKIIGKIGGNFLVYKNTRSNYEISVYDNSMRLTDNIDLRFMPQKTLNVDFVAHQDFAWLIYQYQKRNIIHCMAVKINSEGKLLTDPMELDTTSLSFFSDNKIYSTISSEDKSKIMIYKIQKKNDRYNFTTLLFDGSLQLLHKSRILTDFDDKKDIFSDFFVDNKGNFVFTRGNRSSSREFIQQLDLIVKHSDADNFNITPLDLSDKFLDEIKLKVDNINQHYVINSLYYIKRRGNVEGLYTAVWDEENKKLVSQYFAELGDSIRSVAKNEGGNKSALNDFFIRDVILKKDGGYILTAEDYYTQSRSSPWNRYDYLYGGYPSYFSPYYYNYYSPYSYGYFGRQGLYNSGQARYYYNNILILNMDNTGKLEWSNVIHKSQYDDNDDNFLSYSIMLTGGKLHFLFNQLERRIQLLNDQTVSASGEVDRNPPLKNLDRGYQFMPRYAKQVSASQIIIPCIYRNFICFAKIEYP